MAFLSFGLRAFASSGVGDPAIAAAEGGDFDCRGVCRVAAPVQPAVPVVGELQAVRLQAVVRRTEIRCGAVGQREVDVVDGKGRSKEGEVLCELFARSGAEPFGAAAVVYFGDAVDAKFGGASKVEVGEDRDIHQLFNFVYVVHRKRSAGLFILAARPATSGAPINPRRILSENLLVGSRGIVALNACQAI